MMSNLRRQRLFRKIYQTIKSYDTIVIARHIGPDPDALGSQFAMKELIKNKYPNKNVYAIGNPATKFKFMGILDKFGEENLDDVLLIVLDTPDVKRIDGVTIADYKNVVKIDHHPFIDAFAQIELIDENSSSTCQLILEFILRNRLKFSDSIAQNLYLGIVSDTGRFMHDYTSKNTFDLVTKMLKKVDINFTSLYEPLYMRPLSEVKFQGYIFKNLTVTDNGVGYIKITDDVLKEYKVDTASAGNIISELKYINEIIVWIFLTEDKKNNLIRANIRSRGPVINNAASKYGGGGHKFASGARLADWQEADDLISDLDNLCLYYTEKSKE